MKKTVALPPSNNSAFNFFQYNPLQLEGLGSWLQFASREAGSGSQDPMPAPCHGINAQGRPSSRDELRQQSRPRLLGIAAPSQGCYGTGSWLRDDVGNPGIPRQAGPWAPSAEANGLQTVYRQDQVVTGGTDMRPPSSDQVNVWPRGNGFACWLRSPIAPGQTKYAPHPSTRACNT